MILKIILNSLTYERRCFQINDGYIYIYIYIYLFIYLCMYVCIIIIITNACVFEGVYIFCFFVVFCACDSTPGTKLQAKALNVKILSSMLLT